MIDLRAGLGAPPIVLPGLPMQRVGAPSGTPGDAPVMSPSQAAQRALGCVGCANPTSAATSGGALVLPQAGRLAGIGVGDLSTWFDRVPRWAKIAAGVLAFAGVSYGVYRLVR